MGQFFFVPFFDLACASRNRARPGTDSFAGPDVGFLRCPPSGMPPEVHTVPAGVSRLSGRIGFQAHTGTVRFRDLRIKPLKDVADGR